MMKDLVHISIGFGINLGRIYYYEREFHAMIMNNVSIIPFSTKKAHIMSEYLTELLSKTTAEIDWKLNYPTTTTHKKKNKIKALLLEEQTLTKAHLMKYLLLLM